MQSEKSMTRMILQVLVVIREFPEKSAREIGVIMHRQSSIPVDLEWPHKVMARLERSGYVQRIKKGRVYKCKITSEGRKALEILI